jgi:hypothetical protein
MEKMSGLQPEEVPVIMILIQNSGRFLLKRMLQCMNPGLKAFLQETGKSILQHGVVV